MLSYKESLKILKETNALLDGHFILSSGLHSAQYIQCAQLLSKPSKAFKICSSLAEKIKSMFTLKKKKKSAKPNKFGSSSAFSKVGKSNTGIASGSGINKNRRN